MRIQEAQVDTEPLAKLGAQFVARLCAGDFVALGAEFPYFLRWDRERASAIETDLKASLLEVGADHMHPERTDIAVKYFDPPFCSLTALVECRVPTDNGSILLVELVVAGAGSERELSLEQISSFPGVAA